jgi:hypothetical protein
MVQVVPAESVFLTEEELDDDAVELIFVQHDGGMDPAVVEHALQEEIGGRPGRGSG